jgi:hypothetical protein
MVGLVEVSESYGCKDDMLLTKKETSKVRVLCTLVIKYNSTNSLGHHTVSCEVGCAIVHMQLQS